ncbi:MAG: CPXCG motif-containing cysteine-rich protein [Silvanigrellales bacterium]|jgi:hypothetical protein|nr:CPXCG motif-containing cysteine-rich protein [Silvanigrellales bacterium]
MLADLVEISCPYCGEALAVEYDPGQGRRQSFEEDCGVCCRCITIELRVDSRGRIRARTLTEDGTSLD